VIAALVGAGWERLVIAAMIARDCRVIVRAWVAVRSLSGVREGVSCCGVGLRETLDKRARGTLFLWKEDLVDRNHGAEELLVGRNHGAED